MVISISENGNKIELMEKESIVTMTVQHMKAIGMMIFNMEKGMKNGQMVLLIKETMYLAKSMEKESLSGKMKNILKL